MAASTGGNSIMGVLRNWKRWSRNLLNPDTPNAMRSVSNAILREKARFAQPRLPEGFPKLLFDRGFIYHGEVGWYADDAVIAAEWLRERGAAVVDVELWLIANGAVQPHIHTASGPVAYHHWITTLPSETWEQFANRSLSEAKRFMHELNWPENAVEPIYQEPRFCLSWVWKEWLEEDGFKFPE